MLKCSYDIVAFVEAIMSNPNGDPDAGNAPRIDAETGIGYMTPGCLQRKIRNYFAMEYGGRGGYEILIMPDKALNTKYTECYKENGLPTGLKGGDKDVVAAARDYMCKKYVDVRMFGAVMDTGDDRCGKVQGPVQFQYAKSVSPIFSEEIAITRMAKTTEERAKESETEMGSKHIVHYGLYRIQATINAGIAKSQGDYLTEEDLEMLWDAVVNMFENDASAARGKMVMRKVFLLKHPGVLKKKYHQSYDVCDNIVVKEKNPRKPPRCFEDYEITISENMPRCVEVIELL